MSTIRISDPNNSDAIIGVIWVPDGSPRAYYALTGDIRTVLMTSMTTYDFTWEPNPNGVLHGPTLIEFMAYATETYQTATQSDDELGGYAVEFAALGDWPAPANIASDWLGFEVREPDTNGDPIAVFWRAVEPELDPALPWSQRRIVEVYGVLAESPLTSGGLVPFPLVPADPGNTLTQVPNGALATLPDWSSAWSFFSGDPIRPRAIQASYKNFMVPSNPASTRVDIDAQSEWFDLFAPPDRSMTFNVSVLDIINEDGSAQDIEYRFGPTGSAFPLQAGNTESVQIPSGQTIQIGWDNRLQVRTAAATPNFEVTARLFFRDPPQIIEL